MIKPWKLLDHFFQASQNPIWNLDKEPDKQCDATTLWHREPHSTNNGDMFLV